MFVAEMKGKIPTKLQSSEDLLTSSVIGTFQYLSSPLYIQSVLSSSTNLLFDKLSFKQPIKTCSFEFWPRLSQSEPDVLVHLVDENDDEYLICIEAKFWSSKSSEEDTDTDVDLRQAGQRDQLAREIEDLFTTKCHKLMNVTKEKLKKTFLVYLSNQTYMPVNDMKDSIRFVRNVDFSQNQLYWLSWKEIFHCLNQFTSFQTKQDELLLGDLKKLLVKKGLNGFTGFQNCFKEVKPFEIQYYPLQKSTTKQFQWYEINEVEKIQWGYGGL